MAAARRPVKFDLAGVDHGAPAGSVCGIVTAMTPPKLTRGRSPMESVSVEFRDRKGQHGIVTLMFPRRLQQDDELWEISMVAGSIIVLCAAQCLGFFKATFGVSKGQDVPCFRAGPPQHTADGSYLLW